MADHDDSAVEKGAKGAFEGVKGKAKEAVGSVVGNDELKREGEAQQDKADAQRDAAEKPVSYTHLTLPTSDLV